jgi:hypothetical protein
MAACYGKSFLTFSSSDKTLSIIMIERQIIKRAGGGESGRVRPRLMVPIRVTMSSPVRNLHLHRSQELLDMVQRAMVKAEIQCHIIMKIQIRNQCA